MIGTGFIIAVDYKNISTMASQLIENRKLILVDDDPDLLQLMSIRLRKEGFAVNVSQNGANLEEMVRREHPDVILLDIQMQGITGNDICKKLKAKEETKDIYVILISSKHDIHQIASDSGADNYFPKPVDFKSLIDEIKGIAGKA